MTELSLIIPAYNAASFIEKTFVELGAWLAAHPSAELLIVDDGSSDATAQIAERFATGSDRITIIRLPRNRGKGAALRAGMRGVQGAFVAFTDADLPYGLAVLDHMLAEMKKDFAISLLYGSRSHPQSIQDGYGFVRSAGRLFFGSLIRLLVPDVGDTQCGIKLFRRALADEIAKRGSIKRFAADIEFFAIARARHMRYCDFPVELAHRKESCVRLVRDSLGMFIDMTLIFYRQMTDAYDA